MNWYTILILVVGIVALVYVLGLIITLGFVVTFKRKLSEHSRALVIVLNQKTESLINLIGIIERNGIKLDPRYAALLKEIDIKSFERIYSVESKKSRETLSYVKQELSGIANKSVDFKKNEEFKLASSLIISLDEQFRFLVATYNADVIGYNYWIRFKPYGYIFLLNKTENKDIIS
ncbi:MAG: hypothetical protein WCQ71_04655 [Bacilli bacterium]